MNLNTVDLLLVEDNINDAGLTIRALRKHNLVYNHYHVKEGEEAIDFIFAPGEYVHLRNPENPPKLVLLDIQMNKLNGIKVLQIIKADERTNLKPVVI